MSDQSTTEFKFFLGEEVFVGDVQATIQSATASTYKADEYEVEYIGDDGLKHFAKFFEHQIRQATRH